MPSRPTMFRPRGQAATVVEQQRQADRHRGSARERGYDAAWDKASKEHRRANPLCVYCDHGVFGPEDVKPAALVDHLYPHRAYPEMMWRRAWWVSSCADCHNGPKQLVEQRGLAALDDLARRLGLPTMREGEG